MTYEYACTACGHAWEAEQSISAAPLTECPSCHQASAKRQVSGGAGFILKGGGWYADGYGNQKSANPSAEGSPAEPAPAKEAGAKPAVPTSTPAANTSAPATTTPAVTPSTGSSGAANS